MYLGTVQGTNGPLYIGRSSLDHDTVYNDLSDLYIFWATQSIFSLDGGVSYLNDIPKPYSCRDLVRVSTSPLICLAVMPKIYRS
jgi:hypothetical protein